MLPDLQRAARFYARHGLSVLPWHYGPEGGKKPSLRWKHLQDAAAPVEDVDAWWQAHPTDNVGCVTGRVSGVVVVDCDSEDAIAAVVATCPCTPWQVRTGRGLQFGYRWTQHASNRAAVGPGPWQKVDVRADGGYVAMPPSVHKNGTIYRWEVKPWQHGWELPDFDAAWLPAPPEREPPRVYPPSQDQDGDFRRAQAWMRKREPAVAGQGGHHATCKTAFALAGRGLSWTQAWELLCGWNATCAPPWSEAELRVFLDTAWRKAA